MPSKCQLATVYVYTVNAWLLLWLAVHAVRNDVGSALAPWPEGPLASSSSSLLNSRPRNGVCEELRRESWGIRRKRDARALETGGREGFRLDTAFFGTSGWRGSCSSEEFCPSGLGRGRVKKPAGGASQCRLHIVGTNPWTTGPRTVGSSDGRGDSCH